MQGDGGATTAGGMTFDQGLERLCPYVFLVFALVSTLFLAWNMPPYQGADELAHAHRANAVTFVDTVGERIRIEPFEFGALRGDGELAKASMPFNRVMGRIDQKANYEDFQQSFTQMWQKDSRLIANPGAALYPTHFYLPSGLGLALGKMLDLPVVQSLYLARMANALACVAIGFCAVLLASRARWLMFAILGLPMVAGVAAQVGADGMLITTFALGCALIARAMSAARPMTEREIVVSALCFALVGLAKAPYAIAALLLLTAPVENRRLRTIAVIAVFGATILWTLWMRLLVLGILVDPATGVDPARQVHYLLTNLDDLPALIGKTIHDNSKVYGLMIVGVLGWLDTYLVRPFYPLAGLVLVLAAALSFSRGREGGWRWTAWLAVGLAVAVYGLVHAALYVTWTPVGGPVVAGVQGRYLIPCLVLLCVAVAGARSAWPEVRGVIYARRAVTLALLAFPLLTLMLLQRAVILRYYLD
jgi:uncharacterized membrane protein